MVDLKNEMLNLKYREMIASFNDVFPKFNLERVRARFAHLRKADPHQTIYSVCRALSGGGYSLLIDEQGFWQQECLKFEGNPRQCCAILALVLYSLGFEVSYLEGYRVRDYVARTGILEQFPPSEEEGPKKEEFVRIRNIPNSCIEVTIKGREYYLSPSHLQIDMGTNSLKALLAPECYLDFIGTFRHQNDGAKSGIYIAPLSPENNLQKHNFMKRIVWTNRAFEDDLMKYFATFLRLKLE